MNQDNTRQPIVALVGNPNCGKTALFNLLTGSKQKVANYAGVTVERKEGQTVMANGMRLRLFDLPGAYGLEAETPDERVTLDVISGKFAPEDQPDLIVCVVDATNLRQHLRLAIGLKRFGIPMILALNMNDLAEQGGLKIDSDVLSAELGIPVAKTVAVRKDGVIDLTKILTDRATTRTQVPINQSPITSDILAKDHAEVNRILAKIGADKFNPLKTSDRIDEVILHPIAGPLLLLACLFLMFQAVFSWARPVMDIINASMTGLGSWVEHTLPESALRSLIANGVIAGAGSVLVFLPQIVILFFFILVLEESGYLPRAAFLLDRLMGGVGLSGRSFIPLLSSFACAIPGIMATRTIQNPRDRLTTILIAPLMTCSARLPVYTLIIAAFIPQRSLWMGIEQQGLVLFILYCGGIVSAMAVAYIMKLSRSMRGPQTLMMELPAYHMPALRNIAIGLWQRVYVFLTRVGTIILALMILLWFLSSYPTAPDNAIRPAIEYSFAGQIGKALSTIFAPIGFNWQICIALIPGLAAREVAVGALGTVYALSETGTEAATALQPILSHAWSLPTAVSFLTWYVFAPQCLSTLATVKRETNGWRYPLIMAGYLFALAYIASFIAYQVTLRFAGE
ncbi:MAG TPA: ferrous iron transport protein B [Steroidobacteraceae bacterium]|nr:ferrous iron transport protein B [Steroidobacteraceae bacterium]